MKTILVALASATLLAAPVATISITPAAAQTHGGGGGMAGGGGGAHGGMDGGFGAGVGAGAHGAGLDGGPHGAGAGTGADRAGMNDGFDGAGTGTIADGGVRPPAGDHGDGRGGAEHPFRNPWYYGDPFAYDGPWLSNDGCGWAWDPTTAQYNWATC